MGGYTVKKDKFAQLVVELGDQSDAYRGAYDAKNMKPETIRKRAYELMKDGYVAGRIDELRGEAAKAHRCTVESLLIKLDTAYDTALASETPQCSAAVSAVMAQAKLCGLDKQLVELSGGVDVKHSVALTPAQQKLIDRMLDDEY